MTSSTCRFSSAQQVFEERLVAMYISSTPIPLRLSTQNISMGISRTSVQFKLHTTRQSDRGGGECVRTAAF